MTHEERRLLIWAVRILTDEVLMPEHPRSQRTRELANRVEREAAAIHKKIQREKRRKVQP